MPSLSVLLPLALMLASAKLAGELCERYLRQPAVLAEIAVGILLGRSALGWVNGADPTLQQIAEIGAVLLLFEVGLESDLDELFKVGREALFLAIAGVAIPFVAGDLVARAMGGSGTQSLFVGAALTATSVGITARVFADLGMLHMREARIVLGAAVADDVIGLVVLATVVELAVSGHITLRSVAQTTGIALVSLVGAVFVGLKATPILLKWARAMRTRAAVSSAAVVVCLFSSALAQAAGLAPIVGAFAAGLVLTKTESKVHFEEKVRNIADIFVPVFFVMMGARMDLTSLSLPIVGASVALLAVAILGKVASGLMLPARGINRWLVGIGMVPRGEVGLIFASIGLTRGIISPAIYTGILLVVIATTCVTPALLKLVAPKPPTANREPLLANP